MKTEFVADLVDADSVSRDRLATALAAAAPDALCWCDAPASKVPRRALGEALIASLPQALRLTWPEVLARSHRLPSSLSTEPVRFAPEVDVFDGYRDPLTVRLVADVVLTSRRPGPLEASTEVTVCVTLSVAGTTQFVAFYEAARDLVLPMPR